MNYVKTWRRLRKMALELPAGPTYAATREALESTADFLEHRYAERRLGPVVHHLPAVLTVSVDDVAWQVREFAIPTDTHLSVQLEAMRIPTSSVVTVHLRTRP